MTQTWWLSFTDPDKPKGQQFLGVAIIDVDDMDVARAEPAATALRAAHGLPPLTDPADRWMAGAIGKSYRLKCNPGGSVAAIRIDQIAPPSKLARCPRDQLLQRADLDALGVLEPDPD